MNRMNMRSDKELLFGHAIVHSWWNNPKRTDWTKSQIRREHLRLVKIMRKRGLKHTSPLK